MVYERQFGRLRNYLEGEKQAVMKIEVSNMTSRIWASVNGIQMKSRVGKCVKNTVSSVFSMLSLRLQHAFVKSLCLKPNGIHSSGFQMRNRYGNEVKESSVGTMLFKSVRACEHPGSA